MLKLRHVNNFRRIFGVNQDHALTSTLAVCQENTNTAAKKWYNRLPQQSRQIHIAQILQKYNKKSRYGDESDSDDESVAEFKDERDSKVLKASVNSLRADLLLKTGLGLARNKVETLFYESKVRVNGKKLSKKSVKLEVGDEIDVVRGFSQANPAHLIVSRVIVLDVSEREESLSVQIRRYKSLLIENYPGPNAYKSSEAVQH
ncbi:mitochondrial transcription rescue factor 1 [Anastrepha ludens]|uniref:mitochondrial transcription rescue factor 1 n=1 Tax=Anastrepha ludens TaxID=28586 RepID=UPI0023B13CAA|nr:mitochondrial transcription rescue factor 1 [Anastrepha ludens]